VLTALGAAVSRHTALRVLLRIPLPTAAVPRVLVDFALRRSRSYATVLIDAETGRRVDVLPSRIADVAKAWLRDHPGVQVVGPADGDPGRDRARAQRPGKEPPGSRQVTPRGQQHVKWPGRTGRPPGTDRPAARPP
jgi:hypothetical protein